MEYAEHRAGIKWIGISSTTAVVVPATATTLRAHLLESAVVRVRTRQPRDTFLTPLYPLTLENGSHRYSHYYSQHTRLQAPGSGVRRAPPHMEGPHLQLVGELQQKR